MATIGQNGRSRHTENIVDAGTRKGNCRPELVIPVQPTNGENAATPDIRNVRLSRAVFWRRLQAAC